MTQEQARAVELEWSRLAFIQSAARIAPGLGLNAALIENELSGLPSPEGAWEVMVSFQAIEAPRTNQRAFACLVLARIRAQRGDVSALDMLRAAALHQLAGLHEKVRVSPHMKVAISPGVRADRHDSCWEMGALPPATIDEELRNPRLPNPACPASHGRLEHGFCTCSYTGWWPDWKPLKRQRRRT